MFSEHYNEQQEAQFVVQTIQELMQKENRTLDDFAVFIVRMLSHV